MPRVSAVPFVGWAVLLAACSSLASGPTPPSFLHLSIDSDHQLFLVFEATHRLAPQVTSASGDTVAITSPLSLLSRDTAVAIVDSAARILAVGPGATYVIGSVTIRDQNLVDSVRVSVMCVPGQVIRVLPGQQVLA